MIALIDYRAGNLTSVRKAFLAAGGELEIPFSPAALARADGIVVPGVGHYSATAALDAEWRDAILQRVRAGVPFLGICLGMQWLFEGSAECPRLAGLGLQPGWCRRLSALPPHKVPHVGWNRIDLRADSLLLAGVTTGAYMYFTHSFAAPVTVDTVATTEHGGTFAAAVERGHLWGVQFHPEKSAAAGIRIVRNFLRLVAS